MTEPMPTIMDIDLSDDAVPVEELLAAGDHLLRINKAEFKASKSEKNPGRPFLMMILADPSNPNAKSVFISFLAFVPNDSQREDHGKNARLFRAVYDCFGYTDHARLDADALKGLTGWCKVGVHNSTREGHEHELENYVQIYRKAPFDPTDV